MAVGWITTTELRDYVRAHLQRLGGLHSDWEALLDAAHDAAYGEIISALSARGYTIAQINRWLRRREFHRDIAAWWTLSRAAATNEGLNPQMLDVLDRRAELTGNENLPPVPLVDDAGAFMAPENATGMPSAFRVSTEGDLFVLDPMDPRIGEVTRF